MASEGVLVVGDSIQGYTERNGYLYWDISPDLRDERKAFLEEPFYRVTTWRYGATRAIAHIYTTRWAQIKRAYQPISERKVYLSYKELHYSIRTAYVYQDTRERLGYTEALFTQTPLVLKYPKYYNWHYIPQILNPKFRIWSFYDLDLDSITLKITTDKGKLILLNSGKDKDKFKVEKIADKIYEVTIYVDQIFDEGEKVNLYLSCYDEKGNLLKDGFW